MDKLVIGPGQARVRAVETDLDELVESIRIHGLLEPIVVSPVGNDGRFEIVSGQRRYLAHQELNRSSILAVILPPTDEMSAKVLSLTENLLRRALETKDLVDVCTTLFRKYGSVKEVATETGIPYNKVRKYVKYDRLLPTLKDGVDGARFSLDSALFVQDLVEASTVSEQEALDLAAAFEGLSHAAKRDVRRTLRSSGDLAHPRDVVATAQGEAQTKPLAARRLAVTVSRSQLASLVEYADHLGVPLDVAANRALSTGLKAITRNRRHSSRKRHS